jgi:capsid protein
MNALGRIGNWLRRTFVPRSTAAQKEAALAQIRDQFREHMRARYDGTSTNRLNQNHWAAADYLSPSGANSVQQRHIARMRARYEYGSNPLYAGIINTLADHTIGTGPRVEFQYPDLNLNRQLESLWTEWDVAAEFGAKMHLAKLTEANQGECFGLTIGNPRLQSRIQLDYQLLEADYVTSLRPWYNRWQSDGVTYDTCWNPLSYTIVTEAPNDLVPIVVGTQQHVVDASRVWHFYRATRPGQLRGMPALLAAFELLAVLRRYIESTATAAEVAAAFAVFFTNKNAASFNDTKNTSGPQAWDFMEIVRGMATMLPDGIEANQIRPEQPTQSFDAFVNACVQLLTRCVQMPLNIALGNSSGYSYSGGRLDMQIYWKSIDVDRVTRIQPKILARVLRDWIKEAELVLQRGKGALSSQPVPHEWHWPSQVSIDPTQDVLHAKHAKEGKQCEKLRGIQRDCPSRNPLRMPGCGSFRAVPNSFGQVECPANHRQRQRRQPPKPARTNSHRRSVVSTC